MNDHHPDLTALLRGELSNAAAIDAAEHARSCERLPCRPGERRPGARAAEQRSNTTLAGDDAAVVGVGAPTALPPELRRELGRHRHTQRPAGRRRGRSTRRRRCRGRHRSDPGPARRGGHPASRCPADRRPWSRSRARRPARVSMGDPATPSPACSWPRSRCRALRGATSTTRGSSTPRTNKMLPLGQVTPGDGGHLRDPGVPGGVVLRDRREPRGRRRRPRRTRSPPCSGRRTPTRATPTLLSPATSTIPR